MARPRQCHPVVGQRDPDAPGAAHAIDRINAKFGYNKLYFGSMQLALEHDAAPMRIPFNRVPDAQSENEASHDPLWLQTMNRFRAIAEGEHRRRERDRKSS